MSLRLSTISLKLEREDHVYVGYLAQISRESSDHVSTKVADC